jgi:hypothetical protein
MGLTAEHFPNSPESPVVPFHGAQTQPETSQRDGVPILCALGIPARAWAARASVLGADG